MFNIPKAIRKKKRNGSFGISEEPVETGSPAIISSVDIRLPKPVYWPNFYTGESGVLFSVKHRFLKAV